MTDIEPARDVVVRDATVGDLPALPAVEAAADARYATSGHPELADGSTIPEEVAARAVERAQLAVATVDDVVAGYRLTHDVSAATGIPISFVCGVPAALDGLQDRLGEPVLGELLPIGLYLRDAWM